MLSSSLTFDLKDKSSDARLCLHKILIGSKIATSALKAELDTIEGKIEVEYEVEYNKEL